MGGKTNKHNTRVDHIFLATNDPRLLCNAASLSPSSWTRPRFIPHENFINILARREGENMDSTFLDINYQAVCMCVCVGVAFFVLGGINCV